MMKYFFSLLFLPIVIHADISTCFGTTSNGHIESAVQLPANGNNFIGYSPIARFLGRTYVHSTVRNIVVSTYKDLESEQPYKVYKYAETGFKNGREFKPHKTHRNGLSIDFMTPVIDETNKSVHLPTHILNKFGYDIEFDENNKFEGLRIDYQAMAAHIVTLHKQSVKSGHDLWRVIFAPELQSGLFETKYAKYLRENISFSNKRSWVRHDEHYHVDFAVLCK